MNYTGERFIPEAIDENNEVTYEHLNRYVSLENQVADLIVLDAACGVGYGSRILAGTAKHVYGIDIDKDAIAYAKKKYFSQNITFDNSSVTKLPYADNFFDIVVSFETIQHLDRALQEDFLSEIKRVLKHDGKLIMSTPDKEEYNKFSQAPNHFHIKEFYSNEFYNFLNSRFNYVNFLYQRNEICNVISGSECDNVKIIRKDYIDSTQGKYVIAICSNTKLKEQNCATLQIQTGKLHHNIKRIYDLQYEVQEKKWAFTLKDEIEKLQSMSNKLKIKLQEKEDILETEHQANRQNEHTQETLRAQLKEAEEKLLLSTQEHSTRIEQLEQTLESTKESFEEKIVKLKGQLTTMKNLSEKNTSTANNIEAYQHLMLTRKDLKVSEFISDVSKNKLILLNPLKVISKLIKLQRSYQKINSKFGNIPRRFLENFDAGRYIQANEDVQNAISEGKFENALEHFIFFGYDEVAGGTRKLYSELDFFNEEKYLLHYDDINKGVQNGDFKTGYEHFLLFGHQELLKGTRFRISKNTEKLDLSLIDPEAMIISHNHIINVPVFEKPLVSIIIPQYNQANYTMACIQSIVEHTSTIPYEIILMDDKSPDEEARKLHYFIKNITFKSNEKNLGFLENCNKGASLAKGEYVLFLNNDTNVQPNWLNSLVELISSDTNIGMVGSRLVYPDGRQQEAGGIIWNDASGWNFGRLDDPIKPDYNYVKEVDYLSGAAIMIRTSLWHKIGGFDKRYIPAYYEDSDLALEVRKHGYKVMYQPKSIVIHFEGISHGTDLGSGIKNYQVKNKEKFIQKWNQELSEQFSNAQDVFLARDRSKDKKHVLVIDHYVPHYDKDAGSRTMWQYLNMMSEMDYQITFVGDNFYKHEPYSSELEAMGIEVLCGSHYYHHFEDWLQVNGKYFDIVYLLRPHISIKYIDLVKQFTDAKIFYNGTDFHFLRMEREYTLTSDKKLLPAIKEMKKTEIELFEKADCVLTISEFEMNFFKDKFPTWHVEMIPTFIYKEDFPLSQNDDFKKRDGLLFVGGFTHAPNLQGILWFLESIWPDLLYKNPNLKLYIVGSHMPDEISTLKSKHIIPKGFVSDNELSELYNHTRLVIAPLTFGAGVKGKIIESICHGVPVVTTDIGAEGIVNASNILSIGNSPKEFLEKVDLLYNNKVEWSNFRSKQIRYAKEHFTYESTKTLLHTLFEKNYQ